MTNESGMWYPEHLHGHFIRLLAASGDPTFALLKHTASPLPM
jgi:hypothetical protein